MRKVVGRGCLPHYEELSPRRTSPMLTPSTQMSNDLGTIERNGSDGHGVRHTWDGARLRRESIAQGGALRGAESWRPRIEG